MKQKLKEYKEETDNSTIVVGDFNTAQEMVQQGTEKIMKI